MEHCACALLPAPVVLMQKGAIPPGPTQSHPVRQDSGPSQETSTEQVSSRSQIDLLTTMLHQTHIIHDGGIPVPWHRFYHIYTHIFHHHMKALGREDEVLPVQRAGEHSRWMSDVLPSIENTPLEHVLFAWSLTEPIESLHGHLKREELGVIDQSHASWRWGGADGWETSIK